MKMLTRIDVVVIFFLIFLSFISFFIFLGFGQDQTRILNIYTEGKLCATYELGTIKKPFKYDVQNQNGSVEIYISREKCYVTDSSCKDKLCQRQFSISKKNQIITCLPNKVILEIVSKNNKKDVDMVAY